MTKLSRACTAPTLLVLCVCPMATAADVYRHVITDSEHNVQQEAVEITPATLGLGSGGSWSVTKQTLRGGKQEGVGLITIDNGRLQIDLIETRGLSILAVRDGHLRVGWNSPVKEVVHPQWINLTSRGGLGWLEGFNELMVRCGLEYAGHPGRDEFITNTGEVGELELSLHGRIGNLPASKVEVLIDRQPPHTIRVRGVVHERQFYGPKLELVAEISTTPGTGTFQITDTVTNHGAGEQEFELIYHTNYGRPLLEAGATVHVAAKSVTPMNDRAAEGIEHFARYEGPTPGFTEQVYLIEPLADSRGETVALLQSAEGDNGATIRWSTAELPYFTLWKNTTGEADGYVTGLEPGTNFPYNRMVERKGGRLSTLNPGESRTFVLTLGVHRTADEVAEVRSEIEKIQGSETPLLVEQPPEIE